MLSAEVPIREGQVLTGTLFSEPMQVETVRANGPGVWVAGLVGQRSERFRRGAEGRLTQAETRHAEVLARRERRREKLRRQRAVTLQGVERLASVLILPHPEGSILDVRRLRPHPETEMTAMRVVIEHETAQGRQVYDVHEKNLGYDVTSLDLQSGELRLIEVKGLAAATGSILLTPNERRVAEDRPDCFWLYVVTNCASSPELREPIKDPARFPWHEVTKVQHYWLDVNAMTQPPRERGWPVSGSLNESVDGSTDGNIPGKAQ